MPGKRSRAPRVETLFTSAQKAGLRVTGATIKDGVVELKFAPGDGEPPTGGETPEDVKNLL
jgi:hypothetical protein